ncbi:MAG: 3-ketoacyl-ACP reductase [Oscillospiraceae bacterium]|nr:3-ketoacyl-ACP reductase [Oscillospiraceae bacterium]
MRKTAIVTGAARGIGFAIAKELENQGYCIVNFDLQGNDEEAWLQVQGSIASAEDRQRCLDLTLTKFGRVDVLVNNAGVAPNVRTDLLDMPEESFDRVLGINCKGTFFMSQLIAKQMIVQDCTGKKRGTIINISSCSAEVASVNRGEYYISKAGTAMTTKLFAARLAEEGIYVHEIRPGIIATDMTSGVREKYDNMIAVGVFPIARWGTPEDVAQAVVAFCSNAFLYTTGNHIDVDGGFHIRRL